VVLWGYAENGVGVIVACVATLRPLFRDLFNLGGDTSPHNTPGANYGRRSNVRLGSQGGEEWVSLSEHEMASKVQGGMTRDSSSQEHILGSDIKVTRTVVQSTKHVGA
jgi:hypothetical protein